MKHAASKNTTTKPLSINIHYRIYEVLLLFTVAVSVFLLLALLSYHRSDPGWSVAATHQSIANAGGKAGAWFADLFLYLFGFTAYLFPFLLAFSAWLLFRLRMNEGIVHYSSVTLRLVGLIMILLGGSGLTGLYLHSLKGYLPFTAGGILGEGIAKDLANLFNPVGSTVILAAIVLGGLTLFCGVSWIKNIELLGQIILNVIKHFNQFRIKLKADLIARCKAYKAARLVKKVAQPKPMIEPVVKIDVSAEKTSTKKITRIEPSLMAVEPTSGNIEIPPSRVPMTPSLNQNLLQTVKKSSVQSVVQAIPAAVGSREDLDAGSPTQGLPTLELLDDSKPTHSTGYSDEQLQLIARQVEMKLREFSVEARVVAMLAGPVITRFELELAAGTKVSKLTGLAKDIARSLAVVSVRVVEVIPGKPYVGLELPNEGREIVRLHEVLASSAYQEALSPLTLALGKDIAGHAVAVDLAKMPHLLVAGTTGAGKSVCLNAMLLSFLYKATPEELRLILVDPKMLELSIYEGIPHLLTPVVTDMKEAASALKWCVAEMDRRYRLMAALGVRNLAGFNKKVSDARHQGTPILDPLWQPAVCEEQPYLQTLPYIVVLIDEFADMMMVVGKKVEELIARIAQKARAAGIHLILATQRPSVDVITGLIKANIPTRIAFQVSSRIDSRTILDQQGAEQLLGHGDMLYLAPGTGVPVRVHGAFVSDQEVHSVVADWKKRGGSPIYLTEILEAASSDKNSDGFSGGENEGEDVDPLYDQAVYIVTETRRASISNIQRRLKIGYNRAARLVEDMEREGIVSPMESNGNREVLAPPPPKE